MIQPCFIKVIFLYFKNYDVATKSFEQQTEIKIKKLFHNVQLFLKRCHVVPRVMLKYNIAIFKYIKIKTCKIFQNSRSYRRVPGRESKMKHENV